MELLLPIFHYLAIFLTGAVLLAEFVLLRLEFTGPSLKLLGKLDLMYGLFAVLIVVSGLLRVYLGDVPAAHWAANPAFWVKVTLFVAVGVLSIVPTIRILNWTKAYAATGALPDAAARKKTGPYLHAELGLFFLIPISAVLMTA
jgi:putative membrane protein